MAVWDNENKWKKEKKMTNSIWGRATDNISFSYNGKYNPPPHTLTHTQEYTCTCFIRQEVILFKEKNI